MRIIPFALVAVVVAGAGVASSSSDDSERKAGDVVTDLNELEVGDCIDDSTFDEPDAVMSGVITVALCDGPHDVEVSRVHTLEAGEGATYPGESALTEPSIEICERAFESYVGSDYYESSLDYNFYFPTEQSWGKYDDRTTVCVVFDPSLEPLDAPVAGSER